MLEQGAVRVRVALVPRSAEAKPLFFDLSQSSFFYKKKLKYIYILKNIYMYFFFFKYCKIFNMFFLKTKLKKKQKNSLSFAHVFCNLFVPSTWLKKIEFFFKKKVKLLLFVMCIIY
jgi:hypothetical protein